MSHSSSYNKNTILDFNTKNSFSENTINFINSMPYFEMESFSNVFREESTGFINKLGINIKMINILNYSEGDIVANCRDLNAFRGLKVTNWIQWYTIWINFL